MGSDLFENSDSLLKLKLAVDFNAVAETALVVCPDGMNCIITKVVLLNPSNPLTTASISFGWNTAQANDVIANAVRLLTAAFINYEIIPAKSDAVRGDELETFKVDVQTVEGGALTVDIAVFGFLYPA